jgi:hypothetical protein
VAIPFVRLAHCRRCGNLDLHRISRDHVDGSVAWLCRMAGIPAYRCPPCRYKFFSVLPNRHIRSIEALQAEAEEAAKEKAPEQKETATTSV